MHGVRKDKIAGIKHTKQCKTENREPVVVSAGGGGGG